MSASEVLLQEFAYGEELDTLGQRSLGYRLVAPAGGTSWSHEVEALARHLQAAPYPDHWPPVDLFCSVILTDGQRAIAVARYGVIDHTAGHRRGGFELIGVVAENILPMTEILAIYRWLSQHRAAAEDLHALGGQARLSAILEKGPAPSSPSEPVLALPIGEWRDSALKLAAASSTDPDRYLRRPEFNTNVAWQWLPFVGPDFPLREQAQRGPLVAWTPKAGEHSG